MSFDLHAHLLKQFNHADFRSSQELIIKKIMAGQSLLSLMPTGAGKSLLFQFVASLVEGSELVLVVSPLIALMQDQSNRANAHNIESTYINSSLSAEQKINRMQQIADGKFKLIFVAPERFQKPEFWKCLETRKIKLFVVDEAHCISLWGHDFRPDYFKLQSYREKLGHPPLLALTATATADVQKDIADQFKLNLKTDLVLGGLERPNLALNFFDLYGDPEKNEKIIGFLDVQKSNSGIIYFSLIQTLESVSRFLQQKKFNHVKYHGDLPSDIRRRNQNDFLKGKVPLILATPAFGLGIDKPDIRYVVHYEIPSTIEAYFQEVGRAGRDGNLAEGYFLYDQEDLSIQMQFLTWAYPESSFIEKVYDLIQSKPEIVSVQGYDYLREQMVFKNKKDFRVNSAVSILNRWGCLEEDETPFGFKAARKPTSEDYKLEDQNVLKKEHQKKLLALMQFVKNDQVCRLKQVYHYFGHEVEKDCGICDVCKR